MVRAVLNAMPVVFGAGCAGPMSTPQALPDSIERRWHHPQPTEAGSGDPVSYLAAGDPAYPRVILVHGTPGQATNFTGFLTEPGDGFEWLAIDRPGFGASDTGTAVVSLERQAAALEPLLVERSGRGPILVGHSLGGPIVARAAVDHPDRVGALVIIAGSLDPDLEKILAIQRLGEFAFVPALLPSWARHANRELIALEDELRALAPRLAEIRCPIVVVHGTQDTLVPFDNVAFMRRAFAGLYDVEFVTLEGANHFLPWNARREVCAAIDRAAVMAGVPRIEPLPGP